MPSQIEQLEESIAALEQSSEPESPALKGMKLKVAGLYNRRAKEKFNLKVNELLGRSWAQ